MTDTNFKLPFTADGWIEATTVDLSTSSPEIAWKEVIAKLPYLTADDRHIASGNHTIVRDPAAYTAGFHIAPELRVVAIQGGWWYRGVTAVELHEAGSKITYVVVNVARGWTRWVAHTFQARSHRASSHSHRATSA